MLNIRTLKSSEDNYNKIDCWSCSVKPKYLSSIVVNDEIIIYNVCKKCLLKATLDITEFECTREGYLCLFCKKKEDTFLYNDFYCKNCLLKLSSFITDYLESIVDD